MKLIPKLLLSVSLLSPIAQAADIGVQHGMLYIRGKLEQGDAMRVYNLLNDGSVSRAAIVLDSNGGSLLEAELIATMSLDAKLHTVVAGRCLSACVNILMTGQTKSYFKHTTEKYISTAGVHTPYYWLDGKVVEDEKYSSTWWKYYGTLHAGGMESPDVIKFMNKVYTTPSNTMYEFSEKELIGMGFKKIDYAEE